MKGKLLLICGLFGTDKTTVCRMLVASDSRFTSGQAMITREIKSNGKDNTEKVNIEYKEIKQINELIELGKFNTKDDIYHEIKYNTIANALDKGVNLVLEWDIKRINFWDDKFPVFKVVLMPWAKDVILENLKEDRDGKRKDRLIKEIPLIIDNVSADVFVSNCDCALMDTIQKIRKSFLK